jgi:hypothetical protein
MKFASSRDIIQLHRAATERGFAGFHKEIHPIQVIPDALVLFIRE